jgi:hypothetical protein
MHETIIQRIPCGGLAPEAQVHLGFEALLTAAHLLEFSAIDELENALEDTRESLVVLAGAGELARITFHLQDPNGLFGVSVLFDPYDVADFEAVDLSRLRLLASPNAFGHIEIACLDTGFVAALVGAQWLPLPSVSLSFTCSEVTHNDGCDEPSQEDRNVNDNGFEAWRESTGEVNDFYDQLPDPDRL